MNEQLASRPASGLQHPGIEAIDLFCGVGGLSYGLQAADITVVAGVDLDDDCRYPFETNIEAPFIGLDVRDVTSEQLLPLWSGERVRLLAGCAPCQPFSPYRRGQDTSSDEKWPLLAEFGRLVSETWPELVTMENVPRIGSSTVFQDFVEHLGDCGYWVDWRSCHGPQFGLPQNRRRLVLVASLLGPIEVPTGPLSTAEYVTVWDAIGDLPPVEQGQADSSDRLHLSRRLTDTNLQRIRASRPGGTWADWPETLRAPCHQRATGASFKNVYARMSWDEPSPTITTLAHNFGAGRFGHPEQDRPITLREAAMLQGFPRAYAFVPDGQPVAITTIGRLIGNAVPPPLAEAVGQALQSHVREYASAL